MWFSLAWRGSVDQIYIIDTVPFVQALEYQTSFSDLSKMTDIRPPPRALMGRSRRRVDTDEQNSPRDSSNRHARLEARQQWFWMDRFLSVLSPEFPILPVSNPTYIQSFPFAENALNLRTTSAGKSHSSVRNISTTSTGNKDRRHIDSESAEQISWISQPFVNTEDSHQRRNSELGEALEPMLGDGKVASVLLCWGERHRCHIIPVNIANSADEAAAWGEIHEAWYTYRGHWRRYLPFFGVRQVDIVEVCHVTAPRLPASGTNRSFKISIAGLISKDNAKPIYVGMYTVEDLDAERRQLEETITNYQPQEPPCKYNLSTGRVDCFLDTCVSYIIDGEECPEEMYHAAQRGLMRLHTRPLLTQLFSDPRLAALSRFLNREGIVYSHL